MRCLLAPRFCALGKRRFAAMGAFVSVYVMEVGAGEQTVVCVRARSPFEASALPELIIGHWRFVHRSSRERGLAMREKEGGSFVSWLLVPRGQSNLTATVF